VIGYGRAAEQELRKLAPKVRLDPGAVSYMIHRGTEDPLRFFVYEEYESMDAIKYHVSTPHFKAFSAALSSLMDGQIEISRYQQII
jgi:quinol monooxygenase YgiN